ncbi:dihydroorotase, homodimeric type [Thamnocephalis sphaerospora]|uniref:dihydroorotase n=1 Tax=Thamnocephalis sphaerospora TaxID=78915 RepID=A0A4V1IX75_9FUNG|nr:dihydroorotase, homodimeric type [Thamnocephalis sphaerospora]|eukprot:RKP10079.1 dihydroorotase, homodimeric type [Thamnocephalis sphaerospora]
MATPTDTLTLPYAADFHVHLRHGDMMRMVTPTLRSGGVNVAYVMPNLVPPIKTTEEALRYKAELEAIEPRVTYLMTLYLTPELTPEEIHKAAAAGIAGVKSYPRGVTTNSDAGVESYEIYYPVFEAMEACGMVLNLHGEVPSDADKGVCVLNAEEKFLPWLRTLHERFPRLRIVLEHATTKAAVDMVKSLGDTVGCTITAHHLCLVVDDWAGKPHSFCKPVAKYPYDRQALRDVVKEGHPRFFLGSDSAPHTRNTKECAQACAGVYTTPALVPYLAALFDELNCLDKLQGFACDFGRRFYGVQAGLDEGAMTLKRGNWEVPSVYAAATENGSLEVVPFKAGQKLGWQLQ